MSYKDIDGVTELTADELFGPEHAGTALVVPKRREVSIQKRREDIQAAFESGLRIVWGDANVLLIDCDSAEAYHRVIETCRWAQGLLGIYKLTVTRSKSRNWHVYVYLRQSFDQRTRVLLQGALGGDPKRAILDFRRTEQAGNVGETVLFETKTAKEVEIDLGVDGELGKYA
jgi:hypothetical protein